MNIRKMKQQYAGIEFKDFILGFYFSICTTLKCIEKFRIPFIKSGIPASNMGSSEARNPAKFAAWYVIVSIVHAGMRVAGHKKVGKNSSPKN